MTNAKSFAEMNTLHEILAVAIADMKLGLEDEAVDFNMQHWHRPNGKGVCVICMAGAVIHYSLAEILTRRAFLSPSSFRQEIRYRLFALNDLRSGSISQAQFSLHYCNQRLKVENRDKAIELERKWFSRMMPEVALAKGKEETKKMIFLLEEMHLDLKAANI